jgi:DNA primase
MSSFSNSSIENLKNQVDIVEVIGQVVQLKKAGSNFKGLCPFHNEKTPSFVVSETKQYFTCFGCGASGDVIEFVKRYYNLDFAEAVEKIANDHGITMERSGYDVDRSEYYEINKMAARFFYEAFTQRANKGYGYMKGRGIAPAVLKKFGIGYADEQWDSLYKHLLARGVEEKKMLELGLISQSKGKSYDKFRNRVIFPIINTSGKVIGFGGRAIDPGDNPKYLNSPESKIFQKKNNLYGLNISRQSAGKEGYIILVEGYMDVIALYQSGITNIAASLGTALTDNQAKLIHRYTKDVVLSYDADAAGRAAALRGIEILKNQDCRVRVLHVTDGKDPDEFVKKNGRPAFLKLVDNALSYGDYKLESAKIGYDLNNDEDKIEYMKKAVDIISTMSPVEEEIYKKKVSRDLGISEAALDRELSGNVEKHDHDFVRAERQEEPVQTDKITALEKTLIKLFLTNENFIDRMAEHEGVLESSLARRLYQTAAAEKKKSEIIDLNLIMDGLTEADRATLADIMANVVVEKNSQDQVFDDCINTWTLEKLSKREQELLLQISMADESDNESGIRKLTDELMEVQRNKRHLQNKLD